MNFKTAFLIFAVFVPAGLAQEFYADAGGPYFGYEGSPILFDGSGSSAPTDALYTWDFGDGYGDIGKTVSYYYLDNGTYTATLTVQHESYGTDSDSAQVMVYNVAPTVDAGADQTVYVGDVVSFYADVTDPGHNDTSIIYWDFGDGTPEQTGGNSATHTYSEAGEYTVTVTAVDDDGGFGNDSLTVYVLVRGAPEIAVSQEVGLLEDNDDNDLFSPGDVAKYIISICNAGAATVYNLLITDTIPTSTEYVGEYEIIDGVVQVPISYLGPDQCEQVEVLVRIGNEGRHTKIVNEIKGEYYDERNVQFLIPEEWIWKYIHDSEYVHGPYIHKKDFASPWEFTNGEGYFFVDENGDLQPMEWNETSNRYYDPRDGGGWISKGKAVPGCDGKSVAKGIHPNVPEDLERFPAFGWSARVRGLALGPGVSLTIYIVNSTRCTMPNRWDGRVLYRNPYIEGGSWADVVKNIVMGQDIKYCQWLMFEVDCPGNDSFWDPKKQSWWGEHDREWDPIWPGPAEQEDEDWLIPRFDSDADFEFYYLPDFGDAEDPKYPSYLRHDGPRHLVPDFEWLGPNVTVEPDAKVNNSDEFDDGANFTIIPNGKSKINVTLTVDNRFAVLWDGSPRYTPQKLLYVNGWLDWNNNSIFEADEHTFGISEDVTQWDSNSKTVEINFTAPDYDLDYVWARIRLDYDENITSPVGPAIFGEVEDYFVKISKPAVDFSIYIIIILLVIFFIGLLVLLRARI